MLLLAVAIAWAVVVLGSLAYAGWSGFGTYRAVRRLERSTAPHIEAIQGAGLSTLEARSTELQGQVAVLNATLARLNAALAVLRILIDAWRAATRPLTFFRGLLRRS
jgi:cell division protein FtsB